LSALVILLAYSGVRTDEALADNLDDCTNQRARTVLRIVRRGRNRATEALALPTVRSLAAYIATRTTGPILNKRGRYGSGTAPLMRLARKADIPA
jgi:hypothetical protein